MSVDAQHLRRVGLSAFDIQTIGGLVKRGGETAWLPHDKPEWLLAGVESLVARRLVQIVERVPHGLFVRLTDEGRRVAAQLEAMSAAPKVEVASP